MGLQGGLTEKSSPTFKSSITSPKNITRTRKMAQPLRTPVALEDDFDLSTAPILCESHLPITLIP